uniref:SAP domain-containing protein n=2 Tax=Phaeomonas parva TaxID=124430 RepID=A0A7S1UJI0_9STRA|mmetsp:Transcript_8439/g.24357  ORF Transcript_8439/g.24357 Transcript_8439/m.24357 type:complete len:450 (+) Transcript_8439:143-1492(+)
MGRGGQKAATPAAASAAGKATGKAPRNNAVELKRAAKTLGGLSDEELRKACEGRGFDIAGDRDALVARLAPYADGVVDKSVPDLMPLVWPPPSKFTFATIKKAIPRHCFQRSAVKSFQHLFVDLSIVAGLAYAASFIDTSDLPTWGKWLAWATYGFWQGAVGTGVWVIAHECGHQAFSPSKFINDSVGWVLHSALLVPYHSWRISHRNHHSNTGSCENDEVFCPARRDDYHDADGDLMRDVPLVTLYRLFMALTVGWMPGYLFLNVTGPHKYNGKVNNHFNPKSALFAPEEYFDIVSSDVGVLLTVAGLGYAVHTFGALAVLKYYWVPYMWVNNWLVMITFLQHTDVFMPHYRKDEWNWLRGALCTVDRSFTPVLNHLFHHITDTHVCHHLFHTMPFYHAQEASKHIKEVLGPYYMKDDTFFLKALWRSMSTCRFVPNEGNIVWYQQHD